VREKNAFHRSRSRRDAKKPATLDIVKSTPCWQRSWDVHQNRNRPGWSYYRRFWSYL